MVNQNIKYKGYNPFKMRGSWIGAVAYLILFYFSFNPFNTIDNFILNNIFNYLSSINATGGNSIIFAFYQFFYYFLYPVIVGFIIGWMIHSIFRYINNKRERK
jgi:hypothetical protein